MDLFQPGFYYDVYLSLETDGTISAIIETRGEEKFFDLTRSVSVSPAGSPEDRVTTYKYANCYIVDPEDDIYDTVKTGDSVGVCDYDGFFFSAMVPGNGSDGILSYGTQRFYPETAKLNNPITAHLIWESSRSLVTDVELINGYVKFKVPGITDKNNYNGSGPSKTYSGRKGNAVIGVYDKDGVCLWSWHKWITDTPKDIVYTYMTDIIVNKIDGDSKKAIDIIKKLSAFYRLSISRGVKYIKIRNELQHAGIYIDIQNSRYAGRIPECPP